jgi:hypothetical protein
MNGNGNTNGNNGQMTMPQSWNDLVVMQPMDPRSLISFASFQNSLSAAQIASFSRSDTFLHNSTWVAPPMEVNTASPAIITATNAMDFDAQEQANVWNGLHQMTSMNAQLPLSVSKLIFLKSDPRFVNSVPLDWTGGTTSSSDIELSFRDNSTTSGTFQNSGSGTIPVFAFPASAYGGTQRVLNITLLKTGRYQMGMRIIDSSGNYSMFEMDWIVL